MRIRLLLVASTLVALVGAYAYGQGQQQPSKLDVVKLKDDLFVIHNAVVPGNTTVLVTNEGVLLVDDNNINQKVGQRMLQQVGYQPDIASNGRVVVDTRDADHEAGDLLQAGLDVSQFASLNGARDPQRRHGHKQHGGKDQVAAAGKTGRLCRLDDVSASGTAHKGPVQHQGHDHHRQGQRGNGEINPTQPQGQVAGGQTDQPEGGGKLVLDVRQVHLQLLDHAHAREQGGTLAEVLMKDPEVTEHFDAEQIAEFTDPANYLGLAPQMVDRVLASVKR